ncbi:MAG: ABC transporter ATP-binding protein [Bradyrhizobiaceae bacterium]|nr:MAG: ABC transporter ATP-binding protein [Bradyrhizobiaceae bacterium]
MTGTLEIEGVYAGYDNADVLENVSLVIEPGQITCLLGSNGAGKSTLIRTILSLTRARRGRIRFNGKDITNLPTHQIVASGIACIPEGRKVFSKLSVEENLYIGAYLVNDRSRIAQRVQEVYEIFPRLQERKTQPAGTLSGGEQAMVSIGRGLMGAPQLLLIDEPSLGLSPKFVSETFRVVEKICATGISVFLVEQNVRQTLAIAHRGYVFSNGKVITSGTADELIRSPEVRGAYFGEKVSA